VEEGRRSTRATPDTLVDAASGVRWLIGEYTQELTVAYREAAAELLLAGARERSALVEAVFTGGIPDRDTLWEAAKLLRCPGKESSSWWPSRRPGSPRRGSRTPRRSWPGGGSARPGSCTPTSRWAWCPCGTPTRSPSCSSCCGAGSGPAAGSARPTLPSATPPAPSTTPAWCWPACPPAPRRWSSSRRRRSACSPPPPRTRPGRWCARCWDRCSTCPTRSVPACWAPCGRGSTPVARRPRPASGSTCTRTPSGTGCGGCRSTRDGPSTIPGPWPSCWPPWTPCGSTSWPSPTASSTSGRRGWRACSPPAASPPATGSACCRTSRSFRCCTTGCCGSGRWWSR
jgi:hypothetical protein